MSESTSDSKLAALEKSLSALIPAAGRIDRDRLLFCAGQASVKGRVWLWPSATALSAVVAVGFGIALLMRPTSLVERVVYVSPEPPASLPASGHSGAPSTFSQPEVSTRQDVAWGGSSAYLHDRDQAIRWGVDALPPSPAIGSETSTPSIEGMLGLPEKKKDDGEAFHFRF
jgi:hypothetical protein